MSSEPEGPAPRSGGKRTRQGRKPAARGNQGMKHQPQRGVEQPPLPAAEAEIPGFVPTPQTGVNLTESAADGPLPVTRLQSANSEASQPAGGHATSSWSEMEGPVEEPSLDEKRPAPTLPRAPIRSTSTFSAPINPPPADSETAESGRPSAAAPTAPPAPTLPLGVTAGANPPNRSGGTAAGAREVVRQTTVGFRGVVVGRRRQHRLNLELVQGSLFDVDARALVLGLFQNVTPAGPAARLDQLLDGAITNFVQRRMFSAALGEVFILPTGTHLIRAEFIVFVGLGTYDQFGSKQESTVSKPGSETTEILGSGAVAAAGGGELSALLSAYVPMSNVHATSRAPILPHNPQSLVANNLMRCLLHAGIDEFGTLLFGSGSGVESYDSLTNLTTGFVSGLLEYDAHHRFRRIVLCERDPQRYGVMKDQLYHLASTAVFDDVELTIDEERYPELLIEKELRARLGLEVRGEPERVKAEPSVWPENVLYLTVRSLPSADDQDLSFEITALTAGDKATVVSGSKTFSRQALDQLLNEPLQPGFSDPHGFGQRLRDLVIDESIRNLGREQWTSVGQPRDEEHRALEIPHLVLVHDFEASRIPWEVIPIGDEFPVLVSGITRRYMAQNLSIAKWLETRRIDATLDVLLVVNPTGDLAAAELEGERLRERLSKLPLVNLRFLEREQATKARLLAEFESGCYDVIHYAGHASFHPYERQRSGLVAAGGEIISGEDLAKLANLPALVFFNACRSGMMRDGQTVAEVDRNLVLKARIADSPLAHISFAEAFLRGGVANFVGTLWPVEDRGASEFARVFYEELLIGNQIGQALLKARQAIWFPEKKDWANYVFYGSPSFRVKIRQSP